MSDSKEINRLNKDEEFEYFNIYGNSNGFSKWSLEEHNIFSKASLEYNFLKADQLLEILKLVNQYNTNISNKIRTIDEFKIHMKVYQNYLNKLQLRAPIGSGGLGSANSGGLGNLCGLGGGGSGSGSGGLGNLGSDSGTSNLFLNNIVTNNFQSILESLDVTSSIMTTNPTPIPTSLKDVLSIGNNPLFQKNSPPITSTNNLPLTKPLELISKPITTTATKSITNEITTTTTTTTTTTANNNNNNNNNNELNKKDLKLLKEPWTAEDQKKLDDALTKYPSSRFSSVSRWQMISKELGISPKAVALRYNQMLNQLIPKKPTTTTSTVVATSNITNTNNKREDEPTLEVTTTTTTGKRKSRTSMSKESPNKKEKTNHEHTIVTSSSTPLTNPATTKIINETESLLQKNNQLFKQMKSSIMSSTNPPPTVLSEIIENINSCVILTEKWKDENEMPPLPLKVNDLILSLLSTNQNRSISSFKPLSKKVNDWNLVIDDENTNK